MTPQSAHQAALPTAEQMLARAKFLLLQQASELQGYHREPQKFGVVVDIELAPPTTADDFAKNLPVRVIRGPRKDELGLVVSEKPTRDTVLVEFEDGSRMPCTIAGEDPDIELLVPGVSKVTVSTLEGLLKLELPKGIEASVGATACYHAKSGMIVEIVDTELAGSIASVRRVLAEGFAEVDNETGVRTVWSGKFGSVEKGERVVLDPSGAVIIRNLGLDDERFDFDGDTDVTWDDICGLEDAKLDLIEAIEGPYVDKDLHARYRKKAQGGKPLVSGIELYGPHGNGKTMLGKAAASALARIHGKDVKGGFLYIKGPEILEKFVGLAEGTIRLIFAKARRFNQQHGFPAIIYVEEADAMLGKRGSGVSSDMERTIVPAWLAETDGFHESGAILILATNRPDTLDPAVLRAGRIDLKVKVGRPSRKAAQDIFAMNLRNYPIHRGQTAESLAKIATDELFSPERKLYAFEMQNGLERPFVLSHLVSGAMVAGIVSRAVLMAMRRDKASKAQGLSGIAKEDLRAAIDKIEDEERSVNHDDEIGEFQAPFRRDGIKAVRRLSQARA